MIHPLKRSMVAVALLAACGMLPLVLPGTVVGAEAVDPRPCDELFSPQPDATISPRPTPSWDAQNFGVLLACIQDPANYPESGYIASSWRTLQSAIARATDLARTDYQAAAIVLDEATLSLIPRGNTAGLTQLLASLPKLGQAGEYTSATWAVYLPALLAAEQALVDPSNLTQAAVNQLQLKLSQAAYGLVKLDVPTPANSSSAPAASVGPSVSGSVSAGGVLPSVGPNANVVVKVKAAQARLSVIKGQRLSLVARSYTGSGDVRAVTFKSSNKKVASVSKSGVVKGVKAGNATITVKSGSKQVKVKVSVLARKPAAAKVKRVTVKGVAKTLKVGQVAYAAVSFTPVKAPGVKVKYASSNAKVLVVDAAGRITAKAAGIATIKASAGGKSQSIKVQVN
jgi:acylphosphatase